MKTLRFSITTTVPDDVKAHRLMNALRGAVEQHVVPDYSTEPPVTHVTLGGGMTAALDEALNSGDGTYKP